MFPNSMSRTSLGNHFSKFFPITTGVLQGYTLAPFLFMSVVDYILWQKDDSDGIKTHAEYPKENLSDLYLDDDLRRGCCENAPTKAPERFEVV